MVPPIVKVVMLGALLRYGSCQRKDSYTDENRPYEFGFTIEGEQHRYEKKDEKGIIMGEYGFITADGVYHVTVYATDENGNFRILKTKNIRIGLKMIQPTTTTTIKPTIRKLTGLSGCSGCLIPTTTPSPPFSSQPQKSGEQGLHYNREIEENPPIDVRFQTPQINSNPTRSQASINNNPNPIGSIHHPGSNHLNTGNNQITLQPTVGNFNQKSNYPKVPGNTNEIQSGPKQINGIMNVEKADTPATLLRSRENYTNGINNNIHIPPGSEKNTNKFGVHPKSNVELSDTEKKIMDFMTRLYKFNYTLTFHGHEEEGDITGNKRGSYFNNGRDGYQRKVVYLANEFGYQPTVSLVKVDDAATPNELTEKDITELKGNEFLWFIDKTNSSKK